ncbi:Uncharacterised protein [uncultured archaeon]|nr:Uncharacterised protein [uncultured archaeon]
MKFKPMNLKRLQAERTSNSTKKENAAEWTKFECHVGPDREYSDCLLKYDKSSNRYVGLLRKSKGNNNIYVSLDKKEESRILFYMNNSW